MHSPARWLSSLGRLVLPLLFNVVLVEAARAPFQISERAHDGCRSALVQCANTSALCLERRQAQKSGNRVSAYCLKGRTVKGTAYVKDSPCRC